MATTEKTISGLIESQLPDFINAKYQENAPSFRRFIELYYTWLEDEQEGNTVYHIMNSEKYRDIDETEDGFITYFKNELLPYFPERTELELVKILKGAKEFYQKKGTESSIEWLFRVLFNKEAIITYPRENILRASDGKWQLPIAIKVTDSPFVVQATTSTENLFIRIPTVAQNSHYTLGSEFTTTAEFDNSLKRNSVIFAFSSYKVWVVSAASASTLKANLTNYLTSNASTTVSDVDGFEYPRLYDIIVSDADTSFGVNTKLFNILEGFYNNSTVPNNKQVIFSNKLNETSLASIFGTNTANVRIQFDGVKAYEIGNLDKNAFLGANSSYNYGVTSASSILNIDNTDTPCYIFTIAKENGNHTLSTDLSGSTIIANTFFNEDGFILKSKLKYQAENVTSTFTSAVSTNIGTVSFAFKKKTKTPLKSLEKKLVIGETSKAKAVIERVYDRVDEFSKSKYSELFLSNVQGEFINNELIYVELDDEVFTERILGFVTNVSIDPNNRGLRYSIGDPAVIYGGIDTASSGGTSTGFKFATAEVEQITQGIIKSLTLTNGGFGYRADPNTTVAVVRGEGDTTGSGATVKVGSVDTGNGITLAVSTDTIAPYVNNILTANPFQRVTGAGTFNGFPNNALANINSTLSSCFSYNNITFYPISSLILLSEGTGYSRPPKLTYNTVYQVDGTNNIPISSLGYVANVTILSGGTGYANGELLRFNGTSSLANGYINVSPSGAITSVTLTSRGYGYTFSDTSRPTVTVATSSGVGASLKAYGFNDGAEATITVDEVGAIQKIKTTNVGFGYVLKPNVSLKVMDVYVGNLSFAFTPQQSLTVYQGPDIANASFTAAIDMGYASENNQAGSSNATIRVYDYNGTFNVARSLMITQTNQALSTLGNRIYGNGFAKANLTFIDGTVTYPGFFLNTDGFVSADKRLQDKNKYHSFSYVLESDRQLNQFNRTMFNIVHPIGSELIAHTRIADEFDQSPDIAHANTPTYYTKSICSIYGGYSYFSNYYSGNTKLLNLGTANSSQIVGLGGDQYWSNVRLLVPFDSSITTDVSSYAATGTAVGSPTVNNTIYKVGTGSGNFVYNGTDRYVSFGPSTNYRIPTTGTDFTIEGWIYITKYPVGSGSAVPLIKWNGTVNQSIWMRVNGPTSSYSSNGVSFYCLGVDAFGKSDLTTNTWHHFALSRSSGNVIAFINGTQAGSIQSNLVNVDTANPTWNIGATGHSSVSLEPNYCFIDDFRYTVGTGRYTANFSPPVIAYSNSAGGICGNLSSIIANDTIVINSENPDRTIVRVVANASEFTLNTTAPIIVFGYGLLSLNNSVYATSTVNVANKIIANDSLRIFLANGDVIIRTVATNPTSPIIQLSSSPGITANGLGYIIDPYIANSTIKVIREV